MRKRSALRAPTQVEAIERGKEREGERGRRETERREGGRVGKEGRGEGGPRV